MSSQSLIILYREIGKRMVLKPQDEPLKSLETIYEFIIRKLVYPARSASTQNTKSASIWKRAVTEFGGRRVLELRNYCSELVSSTF